MSFPFFSSFSEDCQLLEILYNGVVRRKSSINEEKRQRLVDQARRMTPAERLAVCVQLSETVAVVHLNGKGRRTGTSSDRKS